MLFTVGQWHFAPFWRNKINAFLKLTINISLYQDVGNNYINIQAKCVISYVLRNFRAIIDPFRFNKSTLYLRKVTSRKVQRMRGKRDRIPRTDTFCKFMTTSPDIK